MADILNVEIKAKCDDPNFIREYLNKHNAIYKGVDHQIDTYFNTPKGRLKLRQGNIENTLIYYNRPDQAGPKDSEIKLFRMKDNNPDLLETLNAALGSKVVVDKKREIYFIDNVKFHVDTVEDLGNFMEIEAIDETGEYGRNELERQCRHYMAELKVDEGHLIDKSYSDLLSEITK